MSKVTWMGLKFEEIPKMTALCLKFSNKDLLLAMERASLLIDGWSSSVERINEALQPINEQIAHKDIQLKAILLGEIEPVVVGIVDGKFMGIVSEE